MFERIVPVSGNTKIKNKTTMDDTTKKHLDTVMKGYVQALANVGQFIENAGGQMAQATAHKAETEALIKELNDLGIETPKEDETVPMDGPTEEPTAEETHEPEEEVAGTPV